MLLFTPALKSHTERVEKTKSIGKPEEKPNKNILKALKLKKFIKKVFLKFIFKNNHSFQKEGKKRTKTANSSNLPNSIPKDNIHLEILGISL